MTRPGLKTLLEHARRFEFMPDGGIWPKCMECGRHVNEGHHPKCLIGEAIASLENPPDEYEVRADERAKVEAEVVAWLRAGEGAIRDTFVARATRRHIANALERGEHRRST